MDLSTMLTTVYCLIDDWLKGQRIRQRGEAPRLHDSEVLTLEVVGEFLGYDTDQALFTYFRAHWGDWFPALRTVNRTTFVRQAANLWKVKERLWQFVLSQVEKDEQLLFIDSFPVPLARFGRSYRCQRLREWAAWGYDDVAQQRCFGLRAHVLVASPGVIIGLALHPADVHDRWVAEDLLAGRQGLALGDGNYWSPTLREVVARDGLTLLAPRRSSRKWRRHPWPAWLTQVRRRVETVISQLTERYHAKKVWAHDPWHFCVRWLRKLLSHTIAVWLGQQTALPSPLQFSHLLLD